MASLVSELTGRATGNTVHLPRCAQACFASSSTFSAGGDLCKTIASNLAVEDCLLDACNLPEAIFTRNATEAVCGTPIEDKSMNLIIILSVLSFIAVVSTALKLGYRIFFSQKNGRLDPPDYIVLAGCPIAFGALGVLVGGLWWNGLGKSIWALHQDNLHNFGLYWFILELLYLILLTMIKLVLSVFYLSIFPCKVVQRLLWGSIAIHIVVCVAFVTTFVTQCTPIHYSWTRYRPSLNSAGDGVCHDIVPVCWTNAAFNVAGDLWLIGIPLSQVKKLNLHWKKKIGVAIMFATGLFITFVSILRLKSLNVYGPTSNPTHDFYGIVLWSFMEIIVGIICICMPTVRLVLFRLFPKTFSASSLGTVEYGAHMTPSSLQLAESKHAYRGTEIESTSLRRISSSPHLT